MTWAQIYDNSISKALDWATRAGARLLLAMIILFVSFKLINMIAKKINKRGDSGKIDKTVAKTLAYVLKIALKIAVSICMVGFVGIDTSGLAALVVSVGACIGLALNGAVSNLAGGIIILVTRPFKVDDFIEAQGYSGTVEEIHITVTKIRTVDNKVVYIPNGPLSSGSVVNYSEKDTRRVDFEFTVSKAEDHKKVIEILTNICSSHELTLDTPAPFVKLSKCDAAGATIIARVWVNSGDYWTVKYDITESVKCAFEENGITVPFEQLDVHIKQDK